MKDDVLSEMLDGLHATAALITCFAFSAPWAVHKGKVDGAAFRIAQDGPFWICVEGGAPIRVAAGDLVLLPRGDAHVLSSEPGVVPTPLAEVLAAAGAADSRRPARRAAAPQLVRWGGDGPTVKLAGGIVAIADPPGVAILRDLPPLIHVGAAEQSAAPALGLALEALLQDVVAPGPGWAAAVRRLSETIMIEALRRHLEARTEPAWLGALQDPTVARALALLHEAPHEAWTLDRLARAVGASRSRFAARFSRVVGQGAMAYLAGLRLALAADRLRQGHSVAVVAHAAGYQSEKAFARAFTTWSGSGPGAYRRAAAS